MAEQPVSDMPSASASAFIVDAVPMVLQCPADGAEAAAICKNFSSSMAPAATSSPSSQPSSIGPPDNTMAGMSTVDAAMICAGVVLSQPVVSTTASIG